MNDKMPLKMKILLANDSAERVGGAEIYLYNLIDLLKKKGNQVESYFSRDRLRLDILGSMFNIRNLVKIYKKMKRLNIDVLHIHKYNLSLSVSPLIAAKLLKKKTVVTFHDFGLICANGWCVDKDGKPCDNPSSIRWVFRKSLSNKLFVKKLYDYVKNAIHIFLIRIFADVCICPSKAMADYIRKIFKNKKVIYLPYFNSQNIKKDIKEISNNKIAYVGRLNREKGVKCLIESYKLVIEEVPSAKLIIIGEGKERGNLERLAKQLFPQGNIQFEGLMDHKDVIKIYKNVCVIVTPSLWVENNPLVLYESMAYGIPLIGSKIGGIPDMIKDSYNGYLVEVGKSNELAKKIIYLLKNKKKAMMMGERGRKILQEQFNDKDHLNKLIILYKINKK